MEAKITVGNVTRIRHTLSRAIGSVGWQAHGALGVVGGTTYCTSRNVTSVVCVDRYALTAVVNVVHHETCLAKVTYVSIFIA